MYTTIAATPRPILKALWHCNLIQVCTSIPHIVVCNDEGRGVVFCRWVQSSEKSGSNEVSHWHTAGNLSMTTLAQSHLLVQDGHG